MLINFKKIFNIHIVMILCGYFLIQCGSSKDVSDIGLNISGGVDIEYSQDKQVFYVLNSDYDRSYKNGSILAIDSNGSKIFSEPTYRMGRKLKVVDDVLIALFDVSSGSSEFGMVSIYRIGSDSKLTLIKNWEKTVQCSPVNVALVSGYSYYAIACSNGHLYVGDVGGSFLKKVRNYTTPHRAVMIDPSSQLVFSFPSSDSVKYLIDSEYTDICSYSKESNKCDPSLGPNGIDDEQEKNEGAYLRSLKYLRKYQVGIYSIAKELAKTEGEKFNFEEIGEKSFELKFLYDVIDAGAGKYRYKTGYWDSFYRNEGGVSNFYISRRTKDTSEVLKIKVKKNEIADTDKVGDIFQIDTVQTKEELSNPSLSFPGKILVQDIGGVSYLIVNHFKDFMHFSQEGMSFGYSFKNLNTNKVYEIISKEVNDSYYGFYLNKEGKMLGSSFYGKYIVPISFNEQNGANIGWGDLKNIR